MSDTVAVKKVKLGPTATAYRVGDTVYIYSKKIIKRPGEMVRHHLHIPGSAGAHEQTASLRKWSAENYVMTPADKPGLYHYVVTIGSGEAPVLWPSHNYISRRKTIRPERAGAQLPTVVYPMGTDTMCRFGHPKTPRPGHNGMCYRCSWWREQGVNLKAYNPTHCLNGHELKGNRYLRLRRNKITELCMVCNNDEIISKTGYKSAN